jgi:peptidoglycan hydrolase CwlO-like protein
VIVKLENIGNDISEMKNDLRNIKNDVKSNSENIIRLDESLKSAWKIINHLQGVDVHIEPTRKDENS